jgi:uroporphyrin-3 C-methyltransferase
MSNDKKKTSDKVTEETLKKPNVSKKSEPIDVAEENLADSAKDSTDKTNKESSSDLSSNKATEQASKNTMKDTMEDISDNQAKTDGTTYSNDDKPLFDTKTMPRMDTKQAAQPKSLLTISLLIIILIMLGATSWMGYQQFNMQNDWKTFKQDLIDKNVKQNQLLKTAQEVAASSQKASQKVGEVSKQQANQYQQLNDSLLATQQKVKQLSGRQKQDWLLAEVEYLIQLAELKVSLEQDKLSALTLLKTADERTVEIADNSLVELRQAIAKDIAELELVNSIDITGLSTRLNAISTQVPKLSLISLQVDFTERKAEVKDDKFSWSNVYNKFLTDFVVIKDHGESVKPLMTLNERALLNANIQLALQQAQIALYKQEQSLYDLNINRAIEWVVEHFKQDDSQKVILEQLQQASQINIESQYPKSLNAKKTIKRINKNRLYQWIDNQQRIEQQKNVISTNENTELTNNEIESSANIREDSIDTDDDTSSIDDMQEETAE